VALPSSKAARTWRATHFSISRITCWNRAGSASRGSAPRTSSELTSRLQVGIERFLLRTLRCSPSGGARGSPPTPCAWPLQPYPEWARARWSACGVRRHATRRDAIWQVSMCMTVGDQLHAFCIRRIDRRQGRGATRSNDSGDRPMVNAFGVRQLGIGAEGSDVGAAGSKYPWRLLITYCRMETRRKVLSVSGIARSYS
jgi:hypothetical protein